MKLLLCFGTRPEAIKMAPVIHELSRQGFNFEICVSAQHREMLDQVLEFFEIIPDYDLQLMKSGQSLNSLSAAIFTKIDEVLNKAQPDMVIVHGDTTTASIISQAAFNRQIKVGHVEAGLRTYQKYAPFPEEINRQIIGKIADYHFAPTAQAKIYLLNENIPDEQIIVTGNTVVDSLQWADKKMKALPISIEIEKLNNLLDNSKKLILVTGHRRENFGNGLEEICEALLEISTNRQIEILFPVHLNPHVVSTVEEMLCDQNNIHLVSPVSYPTMLWLMKKSTIIISDSGGIQEEAPAIGKPVLVTRSVSERMEGVEAGFAVLTGTNKNKIVEETSRLLQSQPNYEKRENPYGDGKAAARIVNFLIALEKSSTFRARL